jgi:RNA polymerase sigma-70 factor (ECF subfamily)
VFTSVANPLLASSLTGSKSVEKRPAREAAEEDVALLTTRLAAGDEAAFRQFHERYFDRLYHFLLVVARGQEHEAREALQQTILRVARHARSFESEQAFWSWLQAIARNVARDAGRKQRRYLALLQRFSFRARNFTETQISREEEQMRGVLADCLEELNPVDRELIESKYVEGLTVRELAERAGESEKAVESRLLRLRRGLRQRVLEKLRAS